ncbi:DNA mismatch repair endonuclease MutL [Paenibacillus yanchengensis]|uniref:DNA mismatch repair protein MutL n=1 Tax=Paenibacillus yanchengensis TaxID=2035833 RepID=A0ABW4YJF9_9BACL
MDTNDRKINVLAEQLANQIAAGEVVERPASIVKELVENAIDAGSTTIDITVEEGGLTSITVIDNGSGIHEADIPQAFLRHATSKITTSSDLFRIASLGFRGEALPSIAAVSRIELVSSDNNDGIGTVIAVEGGHITRVERCNAPLGTRIVVKDIFYNTPARLKYMKSVQTEIGHIADYINRIALAHPAISISLKHNGNAILQTIGSGDRLQVIAAVYGRNTAKAMQEISAEDADYTIRGFVSRPELNRSNRNGITVIVNGRYIRSFAINQVLVTAYHTFLPIHRFPLAVIELEMHPTLLDVNVHPSKMEVRFSKEQELKQLLEKTVRAALQSERYIPAGADSVKQKQAKPAYVQDAITFHLNDGIAVTKESVQQPYTSQSNSFSNSDSTSDSMSNSLSNRNSDSKKQSAYTHYPSQPEHSVKIPTDATDRLYKPGKINESDQSTPVQSETVQAEPNITDSTDAIPSHHSTVTFPELHWIGQHHGTYIVAQAEDGLYLIDQHAAHERINYEYFIEKFTKSSQASQTMLLPTTLEYAPQEAKQIRDYLPLLEQAGVQLEPFGGQTFLVRAHPEWMPVGEEAALIEEMTDWLLTERKAVPIDKLREKAAIMCACKASIKANDRLTREEGDMLLRRLASCEQPYTCPHGRPIIVHFSIYELQKMFKRVMS